MALCSGEFCRQRVLNNKQKDINMNLKQYIVMIFTLCTPFAWASENPKDLEQDQKSTAALTLCALPQEVLEYTVGFLSSKDAVSLARSGKKLCELNVFGQLFIDSKQSSEQDLKRIPAGQKHLTILGEGLDHPAFSLFSHLNNLSSSSVSWDFPLDNKEQVGEINLALFNKINACQSLQHLRLEIGRKELDFFPNWDLRPTLNLPHLNVLDVGLHCFSVDGINNLLTSLQHLPDLYELRIATGRINNALLKQFSQGMQMLKKQPGKFLPKLRVLDIADNYFDAIGLNVCEPLLALFPTLEQFYVEPSEELNGEFPAWYEAFLKSRGRKSFR